MPPVLALVGCTILVVGLLIYDTRRTEGSTAALWIPFLWLTIISSRFVSEWINPGATGDFRDGSRIDQPVFLVLIGAAAVIVARRNVSWPRLAWGNAALMLFLAYGAVSIIWSDYPWVAFKRWIKVFGHLLMVLVIYTQPAPLAALRALFRRTAYVLIPTSILLIKYFPQYGRGFSSWNGAAFETGITTNKNSLGLVCLIWGVVLLWEAITSRTAAREQRDRVPVAVHLMLLAMIAWLLRRASSATSLVALMVGIVTVVALGAPRLRRARLLPYVVVLALAVVGIDSQFGLNDMVLAALGRNATLTDRTELWEDVLAFNISPVVGAGFESFWLGSRLGVLWAKWPFLPNQAHNGYLESYLNGGWLGVGAFVLVLASWYRKAGQSLLTDPTFGRLRMGFLAVFLAYNYTEAAMKALHPLFFLLFLMVVDVPRRAPTGMSSPSPATRSRFWATRRMAPIANGGHDPLRRPLDTSSAGNRRKFNRRP